MWPVTVIKMLGPIYRIYEHRLLRQVQAFPVPRHIGLILDGNRRFGRQNNVNDPHDIYMAGANKLDHLLDWCVELDIPAITLWVCSTENLKRPPKEVTSILFAIEKKLKLLAADSQTHNRRIQVRAVGRLELLPPSTLRSTSSRGSSNTRLPWHPFNNRRSLRWTRRDRRCCSRAASGAACAEQIVGRGHRVGDFGGNRPLALCARSS